jgi:2-dehydropantoate 2-reductase
MTVNEDISVIAPATRSGALRVAILGPGAIGGFLASLARRQGAEVTCIASPATVEALRKRGITLRSALFGSYHVDVSAGTRLDQPFDVLCITVKATSLDQALDRVPAEVVSDAVVVPFLNGIEHVARLRERLVRALVVPAVIRVECERNASGEVVQSSPFATIGLAAAAPIDERLARFTSLLGDAGITITVSDDERALLWHKLAIVAPFALLTTYFDEPCGEVRTRHRDELLRVIEEVALVAASDGVSVDQSQILAFFDSAPATMKSSMQRDREEGRELEVDAIGGAVVRLGTIHGVATPALQHLTGGLISGPFTG